MHALTLVLTLLAPWTNRPSDPQAIPIRDVRVVIARAASRVRIRMDDGLKLDLADTDSLILPASEKRFQVASDTKGSLRLSGVARSVETVQISPTRQDTLQLQVFHDERWQEERTYPGSLRVVAIEGGGLDLINHVNIERYVAAVVAQEVWPTFVDEALRAQAVAARTFVLFHMKHRNNAPHDVVATQGSQVYQGVRDDKTGRRAVQATADTKGLALTWADGGTPEIFCAYYSAVCGGMSQSASIFGAINDIAPLAGGVRCIYCKDAPGNTYRWGPVKISLDDLRSRLVDRLGKLKSLGRLRDITVVEKTPSGRAIRLQLVGSKGESDEMTAERFRLIVDPNRILSTDFQLSVRNGIATFDHGKGFGHGLGLCQWGMQGQALAGRPAGEILRYYYPGATITRVY
jgi:stage II sporulation protein D